MVDACVDVTSAFPLTVLVEFLIVFKASVVASLLNSVVAMVDSSEVPSIKTSAVVFDVACLDN